MGSVAEVHVVTKDQAIADVVESTAAAAGVPVRRCRGVTELGVSSGRVILGADQAAEAAAAGWQRSEAIVVGFDALEAARWSVTLGASVAVLPEGAKLLNSVLTGDSGRVGRVIAVVGGSGGVGATTCAAGLAQGAAERGLDVAFVDADIASGGADLIFGAEQSPGWRWPALAGASGRIGTVVEDLVAVDGIAVLSAARGWAGTVPSAAVTASIAALARSCDLVIVDAGRGYGEMAEAALTAAAVVLVVTDARVSSLAASRDFLTRSVRPTQVLVRQRRHGVISGAEVATALEMTPLGEVPDDRELARGAEHGSAPFDCAKRSWRQAITGALDVLVARHG